MRFLYGSSAVGSPLYAKSPFFRSITAVQKIVDRKDRDTNRGRGRDPPCIAVHIDLFMHVSEVDHPLLGMYVAELSPLDSRDAEQP